MIMFLIGLVTGAVMVLGYTAFCIVLTISQKQVIMEKQKEIDQLQRVEVPVEDLSIKFGVPAEKLQTKEVK